MNTKTKLLFTGGLLATLINVAGQPATNATFTRITTGAIATDSFYGFGCAWGDYDADGYLDLIVGDGFGHPNALYHNDGNGTFTRLTTGVIATTPAEADGLAWGD